MALSKLQRAKQYGPSILFIMPTAKQHKYLQHFASIYICKGKFLAASLVMLAQVFQAFPQFMREVCGVIT